MTRARMTCAAMALVPLVAMARETLPAPLAGSAAGDGTEAVTAPAVDAARVEALIDHLGGSYEESTAATAELKRLGTAAVPALVERLATADDDLRWARPMETIAGAAWRSWPRTIRTRRCARRR